MNHDIGYVKKLLENGSRQELIKWLIWNDHNGVYSDQDSESEGLDPLTHKEAIEIVVKAIKEW